MQRFLGSDASLILLDDCSDENLVKNWLDNVYEIEHRELDELVGQKEWEYQTNINDETAAASVIIAPGTMQAISPSMEFSNQQIEAIEKLQKYDKDSWAEWISQYDIESFSDERVKRQMENLAVLGVAALPDNELSEVTLSSFFLKSAQKYRS